MKHFRILLPLLILALVLVLTMLNTLGCAVMTYESVNKTGIVIIFCLCTVVQYIFSMFYSDRKKG